MRTRRNSRFFVIALAAVALVGGSAFTASNTGINDHVAGQGQATVSGVDIKGFDYGLNQDKDKIESVTFDYDPAVLDSPVESYTAEVAIHPQGDTATWSICEFQEDTSSATDIIFCDSTTDGTETSLFSVLMSDADVLALSVMENTN